MDEELDWRLVDWRLVDWRLVLIIKEWDDIEVKEGVCIRGRIRFVLESNDWAGLYSK